MNKPDIEELDYEDSIRCKVCNTYRDKSHIIDDICENCWKKIAEYNDMAVKLHQSSKSSHFIEVQSSLLHIREFFKKEMAWISYLNLCDEKERKELRNQFFEVAQYLEEFINKCDTKFME